MRCLSCDCILTDYEATRKSAHTDQYIDLCNRCFSYVDDDLDVVDRPDLEHEDAESDVDNDELL
jgi:hypothetical protein